MTLRSPFRYPGGKARLATGILSLIPENIPSYCEPFVGGGGVTLRLLDRMLSTDGQVDPVDIALNDADARMASWWRVMANGSDNSFAGLLSMIEDVPATLESHEHFHQWGLDPIGIDLIRAFAGVFLNRTSFSGILSAGPIGGAGQKSVYTVDCRWNPIAQMKMHQEIRALLQSPQITVAVMNGDFREVMTTNPDAFVYADPPYRKPGARLYPSPFTEDDHEDLAGLLVGRPNWLLSYDDHPWVRERYADCEILEVDATYTITSNRKENVKAMELLIRPFDA